MNKYKFKFDISGDCDCDIVQDERGKYLKYEDFKTAIDRLIMELEVSHTIGLSIDDVIKKVKAIMEVGE